MKARLLLSLSMAAISAWGAEDVLSWYPFQAKSTPQAGEIGLENWIEKPAGRRGRIVRKDDRLLYGGQPMKLWGINLCYIKGCAPEKELADKRAAFYPKYGINSVRLHKYADGAAPTGIQSAESFTKLDPAGLDRMDYQIARFKQAGIYVTLSAHFGSVPLGPADREIVPYADELNIGRGRSGRIVTQHSAIYYSPELQEAQIRHITNLLRHKNPYTGVTYAEDPVVAFIEIINEQSVLFYTSMNPLKASPALRKIVGAKFRDWLKQRYGNQEKLLAAWGPESLNRLKEQVPGAAAEDFESGTILPLGNPGYWDPAALEKNGIKRRMLDTLEFLYTLQRDFNLRYVDAVRRAGYKGEVLGSNWQAGRAFSHFANLHTDYVVGTIDRHNYYSGAGGSMFRRAGAGLLSSGMQQVIDRPFMLSEWLETFPSDMVAESAPVIGAYGMGLQGWDVSYAFQNDDPGGFIEALGTWQAAAPNMLGLFPAIARQVLRGDVEESKAVARRNVHVPSLFEAKLGFDDRVRQGYDDKDLDSTKVPAQALVVVRQAVAFTGEYEGTPVFNLQPYRKDGVLVSSTGQLRWKEAEGKEDGYFTIDTAATKAVAGFAAGQKLTLGEVAISPASPFSVIYVTAQGRKETLRSAKNLLVVAMARARNTGMELEQTRKGPVAKARGTGPILLEPVKAEISIRKKGTARVTLLDHDGLPTGRTLDVKDGTFQIDGAKDQTPYYLVEYK